MLSDHSPMGGANAPPWVKPTPAHDNIAGLCGSLGGGGVSHYICIAHRHGVVTLAKGCVYLTVTSLGRILIRRTHAKRNM